MPQRPSSAEPHDAADARVDWDALEKLIHLDPGGRGLASFRRGGAPLDQGHLRGAAIELARNARSVAIVTGFCAVLADRVTAETDGPPGALFLAHVLRSLGLEVTLVTDRFAMPLLECGRTLLGFDSSVLVEFPMEDDAVDRWVEEFFEEGRGRKLSHLVAVERPGPSHTAESLASQPRAGGAPVKRFLAEVPEQERDVCHNMRGASIDAYTAKTGRLFEAARKWKPPIATIGIGDGGNEIGMGSFLWEDVAQAIGAGALGGRIASRAATDFAIIAGVSNWGAYALALAVAALRGAGDESRWLAPEGQRELVEKLVDEAGAVDGRTLEAAATVDGLPLVDYLEPLAAMRRIVSGG
jgi:hypothetical protein